MCLYEDVYGMDLIHERPCRRVKMMMEMEKPGIA